MGILGIALRVFGGAEIQTETSTDERTSGRRIRVSSFHPAFMVGVAKDAHQMLDSELDARIFEPDRRHCG